MTDESIEFSDIWAVHSSQNGRPAIYDWARSEADANARIDELRRNDPAGSTEYWVSRLTSDEVEAFKESGFLPEEA